MDHEAKLAQSAKEFEEQAARMMAETVNPLLGAKSAEFRDALNAHAPQLALGPTLPPPPNTLPPPGRKFRLARQPARAGQGQ